MSSAPEPNERAAHARPPNPTAALALGTATLALVALEVAEGAWMARGGMPSLAYAVLHTLAGCAAVVLGIALGIQRTSRPALAVTLGAITVITGIVTVGASWLALGTSSRAATFFMVGKFVPLGVHLALCVWVVACAAVRVARWIRILGWITLGATLATLAFAVVQRVSPGWALAAIVVIVAWLGGTLALGIGVLVARRTL